MGTLNLLERIQLFERGAVITPSDVTTYENPPLRGVVVLSEGDVTIVLEHEDEEIPFVGVSAGVVLPYTNIKMVKAATTATVASGARRE